VDHDWTIIFHREIAEVEPSSCLFSKTALARSKFILDSLEPNAGKTMILSH
jgi:hypothetical protein